MSDMLNTAEEWAQRGGSSIPPAILRKIHAARFNPDDEEEIYERTHRGVTRPRAAIMSLGRRRSRPRARQRTRRAARRALARSPSGDDGSAPQQLTYATERVADARGPADDQAAHATYEAVCGTHRSRSRRLLPRATAIARLSRLSGGGR